MVRDKRAAPIVVSNGDPHRLSNNMHDSREIGGVC